MEKSNKKFKYNYIICGADGYYEVGYYDIMNLPNVAYFSNMYQGITSPLVRFLLKFTFSKKANRFVKFPFSSIVYPALFKNGFPKDKPTCFLVFGNCSHIYNSTYMDYISRKYPNLKKVLYMQDIVARNSELNIEKAKEKFDLILSYDKGDCEKYGLVYHPTPFSLYPIKTEAKIEESDVFFCGHAKNRYSVILKVYDECVSKGLKCKFFVTGVDGFMERRSDIIYNKPLTYEQILYYVKYTKCILEIMQANADGYTPRTWESIVYDRHLLTNNTSLCKSSYYNANFMHHINSDLNYVHNWINSPVSYDTPIKQSISPLRVLEKIVEKL